MIDLSVMARGRWDSHRFAELRAMRGTPAARRAYDALLRLLSRADRKREQEWDIFVRFCEALPLAIDPAKVDMLDPPWPDLKADVCGSSHYFELGEVVQEDWLKALAQREKNAIIDSPLPLTAVWSPLKSMVEKKASKRYCPQATPLSLLLYSKRNSPHWTVIERLVAERKHEIQASLDSSVFDHLWLFWVNENCVPFTLSKKIINVL